MTERLWNSPELLRQFEADAIGDHDAIPAEYYEPIGPAHAEALTAGAADLLAKNQTKIHVFSEAALARVRPNARGLAAAHVALTLHGTHAFTSLQASSIQETLMLMELHALADEYAEPGEESSVDITAAFIDAGKYAPEHSRRTDVFFRDTYMANQSLIKDFSRNETEPFSTAETGYFAVANFMILGHLIETDLNA
jgi:hypothetical protein